MKKLVVNIYNENGELLDTCFNYKYICEKYKINYSLLSSRINKGLEIKKLYFFKEGVEFFKVERRAKIPVGLVQAYMVYPDGTSETVTAKGYKELERKTGICNITLMNYANTGIYIKKWASKGINVLITTDIEVRKLDKDILSRISKELKPHIYSQCKFALLNNSIYWEWKGVYQMSMNRKNKINKVINQLNSELYVNSIDSSSM